MNDKLEKIDATVAEGALIEGDFQMHWEESRHLGLTTLHVLNTGNQIPHEIGILETENEFESSFDVIIVSNDGDYTERIHYNDFKRARDFAEWSARVCTLAHISIFREFLKEKFKRGEMTGSIEQAGPVVVTEPGVWPRRFNR